MLRPGGRFCFFLNHPLLQTPEQRLDRRPDPRPARAVLADRPVPRRGRDRSRRSRRTCSSRFIHRPLSAATSTRSPTTGCCSSGWSSRRRPPGFLARAEEYAGRGDDPAAAVPRATAQASEARPRTRSVRLERDRHRRDHRAVGRGSLRRGRRARGPRLVRRRQPADLAVDTIVELAAKPGSDIDRLALVAGRQHVEVLHARSASCAPTGHDVRVLFLDASTAELVTPLRRHPPPAPARRRGRRPGRGDRARAGAARAGQGRGRPGIDTTDLNVHQLKDRLVARVRRRRATPAHADRGRELRLQARPAARRRHRDGRAASCPTRTGSDELRPLTGHDPPVRDYVLEPAAGARVPRRASRTCSSSLLPAYEAEGKSYLTVAIGCTGGRHRSVADRRGARRAAAARRASAPRRPTATSHR